MKRKIIGLMAICSALFIASSVKATTGEYSFIFDYGGMHKFSSDTNKSDGETNYYVRQKFYAITPGESPRTRYYSYYKDSKVSKPLNLLYSDGNRHFEAYTISNPLTGSGYQLYGQSVTGYGSGNYQVTGVWTP